VEEPAHVPVLLDEVMQALNVQPEGEYVDATYGRGGHSGAILARLGRAGTLVAMDRDPQAANDAQRRFGSDARFRFRPGAFSTLGRVVAGENLGGKVNGVLFDLGVSSPQFDQPARGFSFRHDGPLDMRMDNTAGESAADWINRADERELMRVIRDYGEERFAKRVARAIVSARLEAPITTTAQLAGVVRRAVPTREPGKDSATRTFQGVRLYINRELDEIEQALPQALESLTAGGRLAVISFHSLEDRIVKRFIQHEARGMQPPLGVPVRAVEIHVRLKPVGKPIYPSAAEIQANPRARSAVLRVAERLASPAAPETTGHA
jgi:16S rRNA (cytosine1402-N4)-methyltransferase